jgi:transcriptional regulator with XRE-family HTH domain
MDPSADPNKGPSSAHRSRLRANRLAEYRDAAELTQDQVADRLQDIAWARHGRRIVPTRELVSKFERGRKNVSKFYRELLCELYGATADDLGLRPPRPPATPPPHTASARYAPEEWLSSAFDPPAAVDDDVERRRFVRLLAAGTLGALLDPEHLAAALGAPRSVNRRLLEDLEAQGREYGRMYWHLGPVALWPAAYGHLSVTRKLHEIAPDGLKRQAASLASEAACLVGIIADRCNRRMDAAMYCTLAGEYADEAQDGRRRAQALVAMRSLYTATMTDVRHSRPARALELLSEAVHAAGPDAPALLRTWIYASRAEDQATLGRETECRADLESAHRALAAGPTRDGGFFDHWDEARLTGYVGSCAVLLERSDEAVVSLEQALRRTPRPLVGPHAAVLTDLGTAYAQRHEIESACDILIEVLDLCEQAGRPEGAGRVIRARDRWLAPSASAAPVRRMDERLGGFRQPGGVLT